MHKIVRIDYLPESAARYGKDYAVVAVDVIRATTSIVTAVLLGRRCFTVASVAAAERLAQRLANPLLIGELGGDVPGGFDMNNSPADLAARSDVQRPAIILSSAGTQLLHTARDAAAVYVACLRNYSAVASYIAGRHEKIAVIGAGSKGEFREEDQLCCAWIAAALVRSGFVPSDTETAELIERWENAPLADFLVSHSIAYLRRSNQTRDLDFIMARVNDTDCVCVQQGSEILPTVPALQAPGSQQWPAAVQQLPL